MIRIVGIFAKARAYVVQTRPTPKRRNASPDRGWSHMAQFNYDGKHVTKEHAELYANKFVLEWQPRMRDLQYRVVNMTVKQAHKLKTKAYKPDGDLKKLRGEFSYDSKLRRHPKLAWTSNKRKTDEKIGTTALANPVVHKPHKWHKDTDRLKRALAYYTLANNW